MAGLEVSAAQAKGSLRREIGDAERILDSQDDHGRWIIR